MPREGTWVMGVLLALDQLGHTLFAPILFYERRANEDETVSSRLGRLKLAHTAKLCNERRLEMVGAPTNPHAVRQFPCDECRKRASISWKYPLAKIIDAGLELIDPGHSIDAIEHDEDAR